MEDEKRLIVLYKSINETFMQGTEGSWVTCLKKETVFDYAKILIFSCDYKSKVFLCC